MQKYGEVIQEMDDLAQKPYAMRFIGEISICIGLSIFLFGVLSIRHANLLLEEKENEK